MARLNRENFLISGFICIVFGAFLTVAGATAVAMTVGVCGIVLYLIGMTMNRHVGLSPQAIADWRPEGGILPDAGRFMYRVDVTLDEPKQTSIVCGPCGHTSLVDGGRPAVYDCPKCHTLLWEEE